MSASELFPGKQNFGGSDLDCVMLIPKAPKQDKAPLGTFQTYCLSNESDVLRVSYQTGTNSLVRNSISIFMGKNVALEIALARNAIKDAQAKSTDLASFTPSDSFFEPDATMKEVPRTAKISGGVVAGLKLSGNSPVYPQIAKERQHSGTVILHAIISKDGSIQALTVVSSPAPELADAAVDAVRTWRYGPYLLLGQPTDVDTTITVNFNMH